MQASEGKACQAAGTAQAKASAQIVKGHLKDLL